MAERYVVLETSITPELDLALAQVVELSGVSKAALVRDALAAHLGAMGVIHPGAAAALVPTRTGGRGLTTLRKKEKK